MKGKTKMNAWNKVFSMLLTLAMILTLVPSINAKAAAPTITVNGKTVTSANAGDILGDGCLSYNSSTNTLTLQKDENSSVTVTSSGDLVINIKKAVFCEGLKISAQGNVKIYTDKERTGGTIYHILDADVKGDFIVDMPNAIFMNPRNDGRNPLKTDLCSIKARNIKINSYYKDYLFPALISCNTLNLTTTGNIDITGGCDGPSIRAKEMNVSCGGNFNVNRTDNGESRYTGIFTEFATMRIAGDFYSSNGYNCIRCDVEAGSIDFGLPGFAMEYLYNDYSDVIKNPRIVSTKGDIKTTSYYGVVFTGIMQSARDIIVVDEGERSNYYYNGAALCGSNGTVIAKRNLVVTSKNEGVKALGDYQQGKLTVSVGNQLDLNVKKGTETGITNENVIVNIPKENQMVITENDGKLTIANVPAAAQPGSSANNSAVNVSYRTHVQSIGWQEFVTNGTMAGTSGMAKRLEGIEIKVSGNSKLGIQYTTHCQSYGWLPWSSNGDMNGTQGERKRLEAIKIQLTGEQKDYYDVYYRVHAQSFGWLGWAKNGEPAGTAGKSKRLEGIQIVIVRKGAAKPGAVFAKVDGTNNVYPKAYYALEGPSPVVNAKPTTNQNPIIPGENDSNVAYRTHVQSYGWQGWKFNGQMSGTSGQAKRLEGIEIKLSNKQYSGNICYTTHVQSYGWQDGTKTGVPNPSNMTTWKKDGEMSGTSGQAKRLEAICINLTGDMAKHYDIYYRVHAQSYGWLGWAKNGAPSGTAGYAKRLEGIQIVLVPKGGQAPALTYNGVTGKAQDAYISRTK